MPRFRTSLWDVHGYVQETWLDRISDTQIDRELNSQRSFSFTIPINDIVYPLLQTRKIVRLHDTDKSLTNGYVTSTTTDTELREKRFTADSTDSLSVGDFLQIYEEPPNSFVGVTNEAVQPGTNVVVELSTNALPSVGDFLKISEEIGKEKIHSTGVSYKSSNSEVIEVLAIDNTSSPKTITVDLAYSYDSGATISSPSRSFVAKVVGVDGLAVYLNRMDFKIAANSRFNGVDFETFRINEISESREDGIPMASVECRHITFDLNDILFFKDARMDVSYSSGGAGLRPDNVVSPSVLLDAILVRHTKTDGTPVSTKSFVRGDLVQFYYSKGQVSSYTSGQSTIAGTDLADWANQKFSPGSLIYIDGLSAPLKINSQNGGTLTLNSQSTSTISNANYYIASSGVYSPDVNSITGIDSEVLTPVFGTVTFNISDKNKLTNASFATTHLANGKIKTGAIVRFQERPDEEYYVSYVHNGADIYLTEELPLDSGSGIKVTVELDEREVNISSMDTSLGILNNLVNKFTDSKQQYYYWVTEDRDINIYRRPESDASNPRDPTSDLVVMYRNDQNRNLRSISREFDYSDFGNRIIPQGANSGWSNVSSGVKVPVSSASIKGVIGTGVTFNTSNPPTLTDTARDENFEELGVLPGMRITRTHNDQSGANPLGLITRSSYVVSVPTATSVVLDENIEIVGNTAWSAGDIYEIDFGVTREQYKLPVDQNRMFRLGDPIRIHQNKQQFTITDSTQVTITKASVNSIATGGSTSTIVDDTQSFTDATHKYAIVHELNSSLPFLVSNVGQSPNDDTFTLTPTAALSWSGKYYKVSSTKQHVLDLDTGTTNITTGTFRGSIGASILQNVSGSVYFGSNEKFDSVQYNITNASEVTGGSATVEWQYYDGAGWEVFEPTKNPEQEGVTASNNFFQGALTNHEVKWVIPRRWTAFGDASTDNINAYWIRAQVTKTTYTGTDPNIANVKCYGWEENKYRGGMIYIESGKAAGQSREIMSNDLDTLVIGSRFPNISDVKGATAIISEKVGQTHVRGFGYRVFSVKSATNSTVTVESILPAHSYYNGLLTVKTGAGQGQVFRITSNVLVSNETEFTIDGVFNPIPDGQIEVFALSQVLHSQDSGLLTAVQGGTGFATISLFTGVNWMANQWVGARAIITDVDNDGYYQMKTVASSDANSVVLTTPWSDQPIQSSGGAGVGCMLIKSHSLYMNVVSGLDFTPNHNDDISLALKMGGGPLTVGKSAHYRTYSTYSVRNILNVEDASFFSEGDIVFVGAQDVPSSDFYNVNRGDQVLGHVATFKKVINTTGTVTSNTSGNLAIDDSLQDFIAEGLVRGVAVKNVGRNDFGMIRDVISSTAVTVTGFAFLPANPPFDPADTYSIQALILEDDLETVPQFGDHVELLGFVDGTSARKNDLIETKFAQSQTNDPTVLYREAKRRLQKLKEIEPRYSVSFVDLYELDPEKYQFDNYALGDTIKIIDEDITGVDGYNLRIIKESFDPALPEDKTHTIEVGKRKRTFLRDDYIPLNLAVSDIRDNIEEVKTLTESPICAYFDVTTRQCVKDTPPNSFCNVNESNRDGRLTRRKTPITRYHCQSYTPITNAKQAGLDNPLNQSFLVSAMGIDSDSFSDTKTYAVDVPFVLDKNKSKVIVFNVEDSSNLSSAIPGSVLIAEIKTDSSGDIIPYNPFNSEFGYGGYIQVRKSASSPGTVYNSDILVTAVGRYEA